MVYLLTSDYLRHTKICGHFFEAIDLYLVLQSRGIRSKILTFSRYFKQFFDRYVDSLYDSAIKINHDDIVYINSFVIELDGPVVILDGALNQVFVKAPSSILLLCSKFSVRHVLSPIKYILRDFRFMNYEFMKEKFHVFDDYEFDQVIHLNYVKKIAFDFYYHPPYFEDRYLFYFGNRIKEIDYPLIKSDKFLYIKDSLPIPKFHQKFYVYIYTPTKRKYDCSNRLIKECQFFGKPVIFDIDYDDPALHIRYKDPLTAVTYTDNDDLINLIKDLCK
jgi:hypothetical protein